ncbi:TonB-dependent receptor [Microbulbifer thermotolerans]|uniref:TonB-dependent receptor n=1 Tax=Microbulbifer thermotolerans TaxID=252514 RepID=UPI00224B68DE|nr:TonB-dependent receptor [Microbulbifer thermotolerans]MCX2782686.1 TonB-dependent receptor [Microbulbifer thermotolerans]
MSDSFKNKKLAAVIASTVALQAAGAMAYELEEVTVTATKRATSLQETPLAISAFDEDTLVENHVTNIFDLRGMAPSLQIRSNGDHGVPLIFIRGQGTIDQTEAGDGGVAFYTDGVFAARAQGATALMYDMERVEVLRGPQGTLFGRNSTAGAVSLITAKPENEFAGSISATLGERNRRELRFMLNTPINDQWAVRFAGVTDQQDGETEFAEGNPFAGEDEYGTKDLSSFRASSMFRPTDNLEWFLSYEYFANKGTGDVPSTDFEDRVNDATAPGSIDLETDTIRTRLDYTFANDMMLSYIGGFTDMSQSQLYGNQYQGDTRNTVSSGHSATSHEIQLKNSDDSRFRWTAGLYAFEEENDIRFDMLHGSWGFTPQDQEVTLSSFQQADRSTESRSAYVQGTLDLTDTWRATAGLRYTDDTRQDQGGRSIDCTYAHGPGPIEIDFANRDEIVADGGQGCYYRQINDMKDEWSNTTYLARLEKDINEDVMVFLSYATGWKSGVLQDGQDASPTNTNENPDIAGNSELVQQPEENSSLELGIKSTLLDNRMTLNANLFLMDYTDMQVTSAIINPETGESRLAKTNAGSATIQGLEFTMNYAVTENGILSVTGSVLDATYDEYDGQETNFNSDAGLNWNSCAIGPGAGTTCENDLWDFSGNTLPNAPELTLNISYKHDISLDNGAILTPRIRMTYQSETYLTYENRGDRPAGTYGPDDPGEKDFDVQEAYAKFDASLTYNSADDSWSAELYGNNLTNEGIKQELFIGGVETAYTWAPSREAGLRFAYRF